MNIDVTERELFLLRRVVWNETVNFETKALKVEQSDSLSRQYWADKGMEYRKLDQSLADQQRAIADAMRA